MAMSMGPDLRELTFQNVIDSILKPAGVKVGGYPDDMFLDMDEEDKEKYTCNICYLIVREARQCDNKHLFCQTCCFAWTLTYSENSKKCPMCRAEQKKYHEVEGVDTLIGKYRVHCPEEKCDFRAPLSMFLQHSHGMKKFRNETSDLESLRPDRPPGPHLLFFGGPTGSNPVERALSLRDQLTQGRMMLHQMMLLLQLEMQLRRQAAMSVMQGQGPRTVDDALALNEQLSEVGGVLHALMHVPISSTTGDDSHPISRIILTAMGGDDDDDSSSASSDSNANTRRRSQYIIRGNRNSRNESSLESQGSHETGARMTIRLSPRGLPSPHEHDSSNSESPPAAPNFTFRSIQPSHSPRQSLLSRESEPIHTERPLRRSDIRSQLYSNTGLTSSNQPPAPSTTPRVLQRQTQNNASLSVQSNAPAASQAEAGSSSTTLISLRQPSQPNRSSQENQTSITRSRERIESNNQSSSTSLPPISTSQLSSGGQANSNRTVPLGHQLGHQRTLRELTSEQPSAPNTNSIVPLGSSTHQLTMREFASERPNIQTSTTTETVSTRDERDDGVVVTVQGSGPTRNPYRLRRQSITRQEPVTEQSQVAQSQVVASAAPFEPIPSQEEPSTSERSSDRSTSERTSRRRSSVGRSNVATQSTQGSSPRASGSQEPARTSGSQEPARTSGSYSPQKRFRRDSSNNRPVLRQVQPNNSGPQGSRNNNRNTGPSQRNQSRERSDNTGDNRTENELPTTSGSLLRARRRSEIQRHIHDSFNNP